MRVGCSGPFWEGATREIAGTLPPRFSHLLISPEVLMVSSWKHSFCLALGEFARVRHGAVESRELKAENRA
jgi:hypothetical protein